MAEKNPERYWKRERIFKQHPEVAATPKLTDALRDTDKEGNVNLAAKERLEAEVNKGPDEETHYGRIRRLNYEWNRDHPIYREHKAELHPWAGEDYNRRALHHVQFGIPNGGGAMTTNPDEIDHVRVVEHSYKNDDGTTGKYTRFERIPLGHDIVEAVGQALGKHVPMPEGYPKEFGGPTLEERRQIAKEHGVRAYKQSMYDDLNPYRRPN